VGVTKVLQIRAKKSRVRNFLRTLGSFFTDFVAHCNVYITFTHAKTSFLAELVLVLRSKIAIAPMAKATKRCLKDSSFKLILPT
jgi:hypothetical protein